MPEARPELVVLTALREEHAALLRALERYGISRSDLEVRPERVEGRLAGMRLLAVCTGVGLERAAAGARRVLEDTSVEVRALVGVGIAGALSPATGFGTLVVGEQVECEGGGTLHCPVAVRQGDGLRRGALLSADHMVTRPAERDDLWRKLGRPEVAAVDMESYSWAREAEAAGVPWLMVRAVSDIAQQELPHFLERCIQDDGDLDRLAVLRGALLRPWHLPSLVRLGRDSRRAAEHAAAAAVSLLHRLAERETV